ncbi:YokU family protein [Peribacillus sp. SCS-37]|uniref:YokU family protein n=1 Tax=Paraperibacillus esterisolvens TaxID=3115296 RepID=UPI00390654DC
MICIWCNLEGASETRSSVFWELPDGTKAIEITGTPTIECSGCGMKYQTDSLTMEIEDQLFLIDTKTLPKVIDYKELMERPRLLKRNYFNFNN